MKSICNLFLVIGIGIFLAACNATGNELKNVGEPLLKGPYLGQKLPGLTAELFAPGIVSTYMFERDMAVAPDGNTIYFSRKLSDKSSLFFVHQTNAGWSEPRLAPFSGNDNDIEPYIQPDGKKMFFVSERPIKPNQKNQFRFNMWQMTQTDSGWSSPVPLGAPINGFGSVTFPSMTKSGTLYFSRLNDDGSEYIYCSRSVNGQFSEPERLPSSINISDAQYNAVISPDEDFIVLPIAKDKKTRYCVSFRDANGNWGALKDLGDAINQGHGGWSPSFSPDGKYFFFHRFSAGKNSDIYWVDAQVIKALCPAK